jgi:3-oxoacyl-[acyl-carrier protein] reductase
MPPTPTPGVPLSLAGRTALITGGSRGIGAAAVRLFHQAGARVAFSYNTAADQALALAAECGGPNLCHPLQQPLNTPEDGQVLIASAVAAFGKDAGGPGTDARSQGKLDCLIVNHGIWPPHDTPIATMSAAQWRSTLATNLDSVFGLVQAAVAQMQSQHRSSQTSPRGHIVLVASTAAQRGEAFHADYAASKGALISLTKSLSSELAPQGIYANCVAPGWTHTDMTSAVFDDPVIAARTNPTIPLGRPAHVDEIAGPILFLCTPLAGFISGEIFNVNGGAVLTG